MRLTVVGRKLMLSRARAIDCELLERDAQCEAVKCAFGRFAGSVPKLLYWKNMRATFRSRYMHVHVAAGGLCCGLPRCAVVVLARVALWRMSRTETMLCCSRSSFIYKDI